MRRAARSIRWALFIVLSLAAILGDTVNYWIGHRVGGKAYSGEVKWIKKDHMERTHAFFEKYGGKAIFLARFVPIVRTFAPFVAGVSQMPYGFFIRWNVIGGIAWVGHLHGCWATSSATFPSSRKTSSWSSLPLSSSRSFRPWYEALKARKELRKPKVEAEA